MTMRCLVSIRLWLAIGFVLCAAPLAHAARLIGHWRLDEPTSPYVDTSGNGNSFVLDPSTTPPSNVIGHEGAAAHLHFSDSPGVSTRLSASGAALQTDTFGFSFWLSPISINSGDNLIAKEMPAGTGAPFVRMTWQVKIGNDDGSSTAPVEFLVRGSDRAHGDFFGSVLSSVRLPLYASSTQWTHIAGGYDAATGKLTLFVGGVPTSAAGRSGANCSNPDPLTVGTVRNGPDWIAYGASAGFDDLRIYDAPPTALEVQALMANPNRTPRLIAHWHFNESAAPYADRHGESPLGLDFNTAQARMAYGVDGNAAQLNFASPPGVSTRLVSYSQALQKDSFGFSFWFHPNSLAPGDNLLGKEMLATSTGPAFTRLAWQVQLGWDNGSGSACLEFLVRGCDRQQGDFFGSVISSARLPLWTASDKWFHIGGGYDSTTGRLTLSINGAESSTDGAPGAHSSDGGALALGTMVNGSSFVAYAGASDIDELQLYDGPPSSTDISVLMTDPGRAIGEDSAPGAPATLVAHWKLDESGPWFGDWSGHQNNLNFDSGTTPIRKVLAADGEGVQLAWEQNPGIASRLYASGAALQTDSFGFSFWVNPTRLSAGESILAKECAPLVGEDFTRLAWQVKVGDGNGTGRAPLELVVRGDDRSQGNFFGSVLSTTTIPLTTDMDAWLHVAGGYDSVSGVLRLSINGIETSSLGRPGAHNSDGSWISIGSVRNGLDFIAYSAIARLDDIQLYDRPLSSYDIAFLRSAPGRQVSPLKHFKTTSFSRNAVGDLSVIFNSNDGWFYVIEASTTLDAYLPLATLSGVGESTTAVVSKATLDRVFGTASRPRIFVRVRALLEDAADTSVALQPADIHPFLNTEKYVPQFHFSLPGAGVGDPNGVLRYQNKYHIFTWDHAASTDLVQWNFLGWPMRDSPPDAGFWTGSVVLDLQNSSGFGSLADPPMVALYTIHDNATGQESVGMAHSSDHINFYNYISNPVVASNDVTFRDPDVFWDSRRNRWFMSVARSAAKNLHFYTSSDLKSWHYEGEFGPEGARNEIWEVPGLVEVPIKDHGNQKKWLLYVGAGTNKVQYFVGDFDGSHFTMDQATRDFLNDGVGLDGDIFANFEGVSYASLGWSSTGGAFGPETGWRGQPGQPASGYLGSRLASSYVNGDYLTASTLTSPVFTITRNCIDFLIAGGNHPGQTCINLIVDGSVVRTATGDDSDVLKWAGWNVAEFKDREARLQIIDDFGGFWGRIYVDHILFSDLLMDQRKEHANWVDWGSDFFAPKVVRDYDGTQHDSTWLGWIGSWQYEQFRPDPDTWGKGAESIFRKLQLIPSPRGYELLQQPIQALQKLRGPITNITPRTVRGTEHLSEFRPTTNTYEIEATFRLVDAAQKFGINLCVSDAPQRVTVGYDSSSGNLYLDRTSSAYVTFGPGFQTTVTAPYRPKGELLKLHIFIDQCSIEVFANDGERVFTSQIYPDPSGTAVELFSAGGPTQLKSLNAWPLASIWK